MACFAKEAEANHPELLALPDEIAICEKAAGYGNLSCKLKVLIFFSSTLLSKISNTWRLSPLLLRINLDSVQSEASALLKRLNETVKKVSNSAEEVKEQYAKVLEVKRQSLLFLQMAAKLHNSALFSWRLDPHPKCFSLSAAGKSGVVRRIKREIRRD